MSSSQQISDQAIATAMVCVCGVNAADHQRKDHPFMWKQDYDPATWKRGSRFAHEGLGPAAGLYITVEDRMRINMTNSLGGTPVQLVARIQRADGQVIPLLQTYTPVANRTLVTNDFDLTEGFLLDVVVSTTAAGIRRGSLFVDVDIIRGAGANAYIARNLIDAYVTTQTAAGWPENDNYESTTPMGAMRSGAQGNPAAGADWTTIVPVGARWQIHALQATLTTSAAVANRQVVFQITDGGGNVFHTAPFTAVQAASVANNYTAGAGETAYTVGIYQLAPLPQQCLLQQGWTIGSVTGNIQAADQWSSIKLMVQEWSEL